MIAMHPFEKQAWASWLNCPANTFDTPGLGFHSNPNLDRTLQLIVLVSRSRVDISLPTQRMSQLRHCLEPLQTRSLVSLTDVFNVVASQAKHFGYILYQAYTGVAQVVLYPSQQVVFLAPPQLKHLEALRHACTEIEWEHSGLHQGSTNTFGLFDHGMLAAAAHYLEYPSGLASLGILTHPAYRGLGYSKLVASAAAQNAFAQGRLLHFQTVLENQAARQVAVQLGCEQFGYSCRIALH